MATFEKYTDTELLAGLFYGEARLVEDTKLDEWKEYISIGNVVMNRVASPIFPKNINKVILQPRQFSCYNSDDPNHLQIIEFLEKRRAVSMYPLCVLLAKQVIKGKVRDFSRGADHYVSARFYENARDAHWCRGMLITAMYGGHIFLKSN